MRLVTFKRAGRLEQRLGALREDGTVVDLVAADPLLEGGMLGLIAGGAASVGRRARRRGAGAGRSRARRCSRPIPRPAKNVFCVGKNYHEHAKEFADSGFDAIDEGGGARGAGGVQQAADQRDRAGRTDPRAPRPDQLGGLRGRAGGGDRPRRARHPQGGRAVPRLRLHDRQRRHRAHAAAQAPAVDPGQGHRRLLPDGPGHRDRRRGAGPRSAPPASPTSTARSGRTRPSPT